MQLRTQVVSNTETAVAQLSPHPKPVPAAVVPVVQVVTSQRGVVVVPVVQEYLVLFPEHRQLMPLAVAVLIAMPLARWVGPALVEMVVDQMGLILPVSTTQVPVVVARTPVPAAPVAPE
jgi:hypothetical protein